MNTRNRTRHAATAVVLFTLSGLAFGAGGTYYRWVDATGTSVNSDRPPPAGVDYEVISTNTNLTYQAAPGEEPAESGESADTDKTVPEAAKISQAQVEKDPEYCASAKQNLETLNTKARIRIHDAEGNYRFLNEEEKAAQRETAETIVAQHCD